MFSWIDPIVENAKQEMDDAIAEMTGEEIPKAPIKKEETDVLHYPFRLPITYLPEDEIRPLSETVGQDLELVVSKSDKSMYQQLFQPSHIFGEATIQDWKKQFTSNILYLRDTQEIIHTMLQQETIH